MHRFRHLLRPALVALALLGIVLSIAGCGSGTGTTVSGVEGASAASSPKARLIAAADAICKRLNSRVDVSPHSNVLTAASKNAVLEQAALAELVKLEAPAAIAAAWNQILEYRRTLARQLVTLVRYERAHDAKDAKALIAAKLHVHHELLAAGARFGASQCAGIG
jgi:hypothetical protein